MNYKIILVVVVVLLALVSTIWIFNKNTESPNTASSPEPAAKEKEWKNDSLKKAAEKLNPNNGESY